MRYFRNIATLFCSAALGLLGMTSCEGGDLYDVNSPDWLSSKIDSIENAKNAGNQEEILEGMQEDVYAIGSTDYTSRFWQSFSKYYIVPNGQKWNAQFNLNINPSDNTYYKNFALIITNDVERGGTGYTEYGAFRFDATGDSAKYNSQWGNHLFFKFAASNQLLSPDDSNADANVQKLGGKVTLTVDRSNPDAFLIKMTNGTVTKTYTQPYALPNLNADATNSNIRCFLVPEGSYINFLSTNIVPVGGLTSAEDKAPLSMVLQNVPAEVDKGLTLEEAMANVSAVVTFEEGVSKTIPAAELMFTAIPNLDELGEKTLVAIYNKTFKGETAAKPIVANGKFSVVEAISSIAVTQAPARSSYYFYTSAATSSLTGRTLAFDPTGMQVTATYANGATAVIDNANLKFSTIPAEAGNHTVTVSTGNGKTAEVGVSVSASTLTQVAASPSALGPEDNSGAFWSAHTDNIKVPVGQTYAVTFTNYSSLASNWNNFVVILRSSDNATEYGVMRADNYGWGNGYAAATVSPAPADWAAWLTAMNGAKVTAYVTNCNNGTADVQAVIKGTDGNTYPLYYLGINTVNVDDLNLAFTIDSSHLVFGPAAAKRHVRR